MEEVLAKTQQELVDLVKKRQAEEEKEDEEISTGTPE